MLELLLAGSKGVPPPYVKAFRLKTKPNAKAIKFLRRNVKFYTRDSLGGVLYFDEGFPSVEVTDVIEYHQFVTWIDVYTLTTPNMPLLQNSSMRVYSDENESIIEVSDWDDCNLNNVGFTGNAIGVLPTTLPPSIGSLTELIVSSVFNQDLSTWDTSNVRSMHGVFSGCTAFNGSLANWNTSKVETTTSMFDQCTAFNQPLDHFDMSKVEFMQGMFSFCRNFNQPLNNWNVSKARNMVHVFIYADKFNQPLDQWDTSSATSMTGMFSNAAVFNQDLSGWNVSKVVTYDNFSTNSAMIESNLPAFV